MPKVKKPTKPRVVKTFVNTKAKYTMKSINDYLQKRGACINQYFIRDEVIPELILRGDILRDSPTEIVGAAVLRFFRGGGGL